VGDAGTETKGTSLEKSVYREGREDLIREKLDERRGKKKISGENALGESKKKKRKKPSKKKSKGKKKGLPGRD